MTLRATNRTSSVVLPATGRVAGGPVRSVLVGGANAAMSPTPVALAGWLDNPAGSYLVREEADVAGIDFSATDWSLEFVMEWPSTGFVGDLSNWFGINAQAATFAGTKGALFYIDSSGREYQTAPTVIAQINDGSANSVSVTTSIAADTPTHFLMCWNTTSKTMTVYKDGTIVSTAQTNGSISLPAALGNIMVGGGDRFSVGYAAGVGEYNGFPEQKLYMARIWSTELTAADAVNLSAQFSTSGRTDVPGTVTGTVVSEYLMTGEVGDSSGGAGTGWLKDDVGGNHLMFRDFGTAPTLYTPADSAVVCSSPADTATSVSGAVALTAAGRSVGQFQQYRFQVILTSGGDFGTPLKDSGWITQHTWRPRLLPSTGYSWRVAAMGQLTTSAWSTAFTLTTRAAQDWFVRTQTTPGTYGTEDGSTYANAWNGIQMFHGGQHDQDKYSPTYHAAAAQLHTDVAPGDTVIMADDFERIITSVGLIAHATVHRFNAYGYDADTPVIIDFSDATYPCRMFGFSKTATATTWTDETGGVWSATVYPAEAWWQLLAEDDGAGSPDLNMLYSTDNLLYEKTHPLGAVGWVVDTGKLYVKLTGGGTPGNDLHFMTQDVILEYQTGGSFIKYSGGEFYNSAILHAADTEYNGCRLRYSTAYMWNVTTGDDRITWDNVEVMQALAGVYTTNGATVSGSDLTIKNCWFHHIGIASTPFSDADAHCVGVQSSNDVVITDNLFEYSGNAIEHWNESKVGTNCTITGNVIRHITTRSNTKGNAISFSGQSPKGNRTGHVISDNVIYDCEGTGIHRTPADYVEITGNLIWDVGNEDVDDFFHNGIHFGWNSGTDAIEGICEDNIISEAHYRAIAIYGHTSNTINFDRNLYYDTGKTAGTTWFYSENDGGDFSFTGRPAGFDDAGAFDDPATAALPTGFRAFYKDFFITPASEALWADSNDDGDVDAADQTLLDAEYSPAAPNAALQRILTFSAGSVYLRPGGVDQFLRPGGVDQYERP